MKIACVSCNAVFDDARCTTICPHEPFLTEKQLAQKDLATRLIGHRVRFAHEDATKPHMVRSVHWDGMVELADMIGRFAPHLFEVIE